MRTLPTGSVDPNFGRRVRNRRQLNSLQNTWSYGYSMPIAVRYTQDAFSRSGWLWPVDFFFSSRRRHTRFDCDWSLDVCSSDLEHRMIAVHELMGGGTEDLLGVDGVRFNDDAVSMGLQAATHWDGLSHVSYAGRMWNGVDPADVDEAGAHRLGVETYGPLVSRGVLLDLARAAGV